jgi:hypothetical protein
MCPGEMTAEYFHLPLHSAFRQNFGTTLDEAAPPFGIPTPHRLRSSSLSLARATSPHLVDPPTLRRRSCFYAEIESPLD